MANKENAKRQIKGLLEKYNKVVVEKKISKYTEADTKAEFIEPLFEALGWDVRNRDEVTREETISKGRVDYGFRISGIPKFFLEAKALREDLDDPKFAEQAINYAWHKGCTWAVLTDFDQGVKIFNAEWKTTDLFQRHLKTIPCQEFIDRFEELWLLSKESFEQGLLDKEAEKWGKKSKKTPVGEQLLTDLTKWRAELYKDIIWRNKDKQLTEEELDEAVQRIIDRLIFIRNCEDKELEPITLISVMREWDSKRKGALFEHIVDVFKYFDEEYNSKLFQHHLCDDLKISNQVFEGIIKDLYHTKDRIINYDFSAMDADVLGNVYEQYLGHILKKTKKRAVLKEKHAYRKEQGIYYTPTYIVDYIVKNTLGELLKNKRANIEKIRILDPACGSGSFLIKAFDVLNEFYSKKKGDSAQTQLDLESGVPFTQKAKILQNNIFGVDLDTRAVEIAQLNLLLKIAEKKQRLPLLQQNIKCGNSLVDDTNVAGDKAFKWGREFKQIMDEGGFDVVIGNPPYVRIQTLDKNQVDFFNSHYEAATRNYDIYGLFVEKGLSLLKEGGVLGFILPSKFFSADYGEGLRKVVSVNKYLHKIVDFKDFQVFGGATTYTCLLFLKKAANDTFEYATLKHENAINTIDNSILNFSKLKQPLQNERWTFTSNEKESILSKISRNELTLKDITDRIFTGIQTSADKIYILKTIKEKEDSVILFSESLNKEVEIERGLIKPFLLGSDVHKYKLPINKRFVIFPYSIVDGRPVLMQQEFIKTNFPMGWDYIFKNRKDLENREKGKMKHDKFYAYIYPKNLSRFECSRIIMPHCALKPELSYDENNIYHTTNVYSIIFNENTKESEMYYLGIFNSKLLAFFMKNKAPPLRGGYINFKPIYLSPFPIPRLDLSDEKNRKIHDKIASLVERILALNKRLNALGDKKTDERQRIEEEINKIDVEIDELVYKLYGITESEKKIIEESLK